MVELMVHGSPYVVRRALERWVEAGCRMARPGELTRRAVANGKMDLLQAEAVADLVRAETRLEYRNARLQLGGGLSREVGAARAALIDLLAGVEAAIDLVGTDVEVGGEEISRSLEGVRRQVDGLLVRASAGARIRHGLRVAIVGAANAGKSTLFNALLGRERAIVAAVAGTTRDVVEAELEIGGVRAVLVDTAGLGLDGDEVDAEATRRAREAARSADVVVEVWAVDGARYPFEAAPDQAVIRARSKVDLGQVPVESGEEACWLGISCVTGQGVAELALRIRRVVEDDQRGMEDVVAIGARHREALARVGALLEECRLVDPELAAEKVREAVEALGELTGEVETEEVLDRIFARFCVGK
jgi:tRNA modification GTPase